MTRMVWGGAVLWVAVVVIASALAWVAIDQAGRQVSASGILISPGAASVSSAQASRTPPPRPTRRPASEPSHPQSSTNAPATTRPPIVTAVPTRTPAAPTRVRSWSGSAGTVTVSCNGTTAQLISASPADGWRAERQAVAGGVGVQFDRGDTSQMLLSATCSGTGPVFKVVVDE